MFGRMMNNYFYGKSGRGDYTPEDLPRTRWQLFWEMLRIRLSGLCRMNLLYMLPWLPAMLVIGTMLLNMVQTLNMPTEMTRIQQIATEARSTGEGLGEDGSVTVTDESTGQTTVYPAELLRQVDDFLALSAGEQAVLQADQMESYLYICLLWLIPCIFITGPWTAGVSWVTRNWARDEHAFIWSDMKDAMKENWKGALGLSAISAVLPLLVYLGWTFYGEQAANSWVMVIPQMVLLLVGFIWSIAVTYAYPMMVTYDMSFSTVIRNSFLLAMGRLPMSVGIRLLHCVPMVLGLCLFLVVGNPVVLLALFAYYLLLGFTLSRFVTASYTNAQFDKYLNSKIEGAEVNRGLNMEDDDEESPDEEEESERELKPWENGYTDR